MRKAITGGMLGAALLLRSVAWACSCGETPSLVVRPAVGDVAAPNTQVWLRLRHDLVAWALCTRETPSPDREPPPCARMPRFVLRRATSTGQPEQAPVAALARTVRSGAFVLVRLSPQATLAPGARYEVWWEEEDDILSPRVVSTFRVGHEEDHSAPVWEGKHDADMRIYEPGKMYICGFPKRLMQILGGPSADGDRPAPLYEFTFLDGKGAQEPFFVFAPHIFDPEGTFFELALAEHGLDGGGGCYDDLARFPDEATFRVKVRALDLAGNASPEVIDAVTYPTPSPPKPPSPRKTPPRPRR